MSKEEEITRILAVSLRQLFARLSVDYGRLEEIRLRVNGPLELACGAGRQFVSDQGRFCGRSEAHIVTPGELRETMEYLSNYSRYAFEEKIRQGFLTVQGGHRVGLCGGVVLDAGRVKTISPVAFLNIRVARQAIGCGREVVFRLWEKGELLDTLVVSPPGLGKTTLLRDLVRLLSDGDGAMACTVGVVDERSELAACYRGVPQNDLGGCTDVLDGCPKAEGMLMLVRSMSPQVVAVDEIGGEEDCRAVEYVMNCGCRIFATAHGAGLKELSRRPIFSRWLAEKRFGRYVLIEREKEAVFYRVCQGDGQTIWRGRRPEGE